VFLREIERVRGRRRKKLHVAAPTFPAAGKILLKSCVFSLALLLVLEGDYRDLGEMVWCRIVISWAEAQS
jgi:hypothetical protein